MSEPRAWLGFFWSITVRPSPPPFVIATGLFLDHHHRGYPLARTIRTWTIILALIEALPFCYFIFLVHFLARVLGGWQ